MLAFTCIEAGLPLPTDSRTKRLADVSLRAFRKSFNQVLWTTRICFQYAFIKVFGLDPETSLDRSVKRFSFVKKVFENTKLPKKCSLS
jgi:hypothetical protein